MNSYRFTTRMEKIIKIAYEIAFPNYVEPVHLFLAASKEGTGVCGELYLYLSKQIGPTFISDILNLYTPGNSIESYHLLEKYEISIFTKNILDSAYEKMSKYNQVYINEGHLIDSILSSCDIPLIDEEIKSNIISNVSVPRDLTVFLSDFTNNNLIIDPEIEVRRVTKSDYEQLRNFVISEFGERWLEAVNNGFNNNHEIPIYISKYNGDIIGFSCFDVVKNKRGLFGPMN